jgi:Protein of unknown function (DUF3617)
MIKITLIALVLAPALLLHAEDRMRSGLWEVTTTMDGQPARTSSTCYSPAMVELANKPAKALREDTGKALAKRPNCTLKDFKMAGNTLSMSQVRGGSPLTITSTYTGGTFETVSTSTDAGVASVYRLKRRPTGPCK